MATVESQSDDGSCNSPRSSPASPRPLSPRRLGRPPPGGRGNDPHEYMPSPDYVATKENIQREVNRAYTSSTALIVYYIGYKHDGTLGASGVSLANSKDFYLFTSDSILSPDMTLSESSRNAFMRKTELYPTCLPNVGVVNTAAAGGHIRGIRNCCQRRA